MTSSRSETIFLKWKEFFSAFAYAMNTTPLSTAEIRERIEMLLRRKLGYPNAVKIHIDEDIFEKKLCQLIALGLIIRDTERGYNYNDYNNEWSLSLKGKKALYKCLECKPQPAEEEKQ